MISLIYRLADSLRHRARRGRQPLHMVNARRGEDLAHRFLRRNGYTVVARNYRPPSGAGEIDLIAWDGPVLVFVEVKCRWSEEFGAPERAVDREKERNLERVARDYARRASVEWNRVRFDIVSVVLEQSPKIELLKDAFRLSRTL